MSAEPTKADLKDVVDHIEHIASVIGRKQCVFTLTPFASRLAELVVVHVGSIGLGSDFDGIDSVISGLEDVSTFPALVRSLFLSNPVYRTIPIP